MKKLFLMAGAMAVLVFSACKKDKDKGPDNNGGSNTKLLKKVTKTEDDATTVYSLNYDGNKRVSSFNSADGDETTTFTYDNAGNITRVDIKEDNYFSTYTYAYKGCVDR